ncbi:hypothetical protein BDP27DRAFT_1405689 [Rhodocollybia butyracea]|uniref:Uncharacterized protein n=1 Tax=Rhodocollybia butyracea TaxID=206335 RepID=A0A9P5U2A5_9AGAR|nr:hypothetical protein BDP27DRAFT_1405689 [Rhodocollybia butyracea]
MVKGRKPLFQQQPTVFVLFHIGRQIKQEAERRFLFNHSISTFSLNSSSSMSHSTKYQWQEKYRDKWILEAETQTYWQSFYDHWKLQPNPMSPSEDQLQIVPENLSPHDFCRSLQHSGTGKMLVLPEYRAIVKRIANLYRQLPDSEVLITGQPGIGKSVFLFYLLAILLSIPDGDTLDSSTGLNFAPVLLYTKATQVLFYDGKTYVPKSRDCPFEFKLLPQPCDITPLPGPVWVLIDMYETKEEPHALSGLSTLFPVQSASPNTVHYKGWRRSRKACRFGLPLWEEAYLHRGWELHAQKPKLQKAISSWAKERDLHYDTLMSCEAKGTLDRKDPKIEVKAMEILITDAIERYGHTARDVYDFLESPSNVVSSPSDVFIDMDWAQWRMAAGEIWYRIAYIVSLELVKPVRWKTHDTFKVIWKTPYIHSRAQLHAKLTEKQRAELFEVIHCFQQQNVRTYYSDVKPRAVYPEIPAVRRKQVPYSGYEDLELDRYYVPQEENALFFDSFYLWDWPTHIIAVFNRVSTGSDINSVLAAIRKKFQKAAYVSYVLVGPAFSSAFTIQKWTIPSEGFVPGKVYYLGVPLPYSVESLKYARDALDFKKAEATETMKDAPFEGETRVQFGLKAQAPMGVDGSRLVTRDLSERGQGIGWQEETTPWDFLDENGEEIVSDDEDPDY